MSSPQHPQFFQRRAFKSITRRFRWPCEQIYSNNSESVASLLPRGPIFGNPTMLDFRPQLDLLRTVEMHMPKKPRRPSKKKTSPQKPSDASGATDIKSSGSTKSSPGKNSKSTKTPVKAIVKATPRGGRNRRNVTPAKPIPQRASATKRNTLTLAVQNPRPTDKKTATIKEEKSGKKRAVQPTGPPPLTSRTPAPAGHPPKEAKVAKAPAQSEQAEQGTTKTKPETKEAIVVAAEKALDKGDTKLSDSVRPEATEPTEPPKAVSGDSPPGSAEVDQKKNTVASRAVSVEEATPSLQSQSGQLEEKEKQTAETPEQITEAVPDQGQEKKESENETEASSSPATASGSPVPESPNTNSNTPDEQKNVKQKDTQNPNTVQAPTAAVREIVLRGEEDSDPTGVSEVQPVPALEMEETAGEANEAKQGADDHPSTGQVSDPAAVAQTEQVSSKPEPSKSEASETEGSERLNDTPTLTSASMAVVEPGAEAGRSRPVDVAVAGQEDDTEPTQSPAEDTEALVDSTLTAADIGIPTPSPAPKITSEATDQAVKPALETDVVEIEPTTTTQTVEKKQDTPDILADPPTKEEKNDKKVVEESVLQSVQSAAVSVEANKEDVTDNRDTEKTMTQSAGHVQVAAEPEPVQTNPPVAVKIGNEEESKAPETLVDEQEVDVQAKTPVDVSTVTLDKEAKAGANHQSVTDTLPVTEGNTNLPSKQAETPSV